MTSAINDPALRLSDQTLVEGRQATMSVARGPELLRDVQRQLGRCLLRLQHYEGLMKTLLAHSELGGSVGQLEAQFAARIKKFSGKSLGTLVNALFESYVVPLGQDDPSPPDGKAPTDQISMKFRFRLEMDEERRSAVKAAVEDLVQMRNDLVHRLVERFDVWTEDGCAAAVEHLYGCYDRIDGHYKELRQWAEALDQARTDAAAFVRSDAFTDLVVNGIAPDGTFDWSHTGIVRVLREAADRLAKDGWVRLDKALAWIAAQHPEQTPKKYRCRTWPQVLSESRCFRLEYREGDAGRVAWYRAAHC
jgi:hypothetical protein